MIERLRNSLYRLKISFFLPLKRSWRIATGRKKVKSICFIVSSLPMWRCQDLYRLLKNDPHFQATVLLSPFASFSPEEKTKCMEELKCYFSGQGVDFIDFTGIESPRAFLRDELRPDILFYQQPYYALYGNGIDSEFFKDKLICYVPYGLCTISTPWLFNQKLCNFAWRLYYSSPVDLIAAKRYADNRARNVRIVGNTLASSFLSEQHPDVWKTQEKPCIRVIWAPHYSITDGFFSRGSFLSLHETMLRLADEYKGTVQFAFKPHPKLISMLYDHPDWGKERTDAYYQQWACGSNTQLETGEYVNLFKTSDAMIHDCVSFTAEYLYVQKPVLFYTNDKDGVIRDLNELGRAAIDAHYFAGDDAGVYRFINEVILNKKDPLTSARAAVYKNYLLPPGGRSAAENIYLDLLQSLKLT